MKKMIRSFVIGWVLVGLPLAQAGGPVFEYEVKAAFLFNFAKFVEWPPQVFHDDVSPITIGVFGENPFGGFLQETVAGQKLGPRPIEVKKLQNLDELQSCQLLFIGASEENSVSEILSRLKGTSVLTVGETENFAESGGVIQFVEKDGKVCFKINRKAAEEARLKISSRLLNLSENL